MTRVPAPFDLLSSTISRLKLRQMSLVLAIIETRNLHRAAKRHARLLIGAVLALAIRPGIRMSLGEDPAVFGSAQAALPHRAPGL
jgi:hypothetical protein